jgi:hypothetical protein
MSRSGVGLLVLRVLLATGMLSLAATPVAADFDQSRSWFEGLTIDERTDLQGNLILLAHYGGIVDGAFGTNTYNAIVGWQGSLGATSTGTLSEDDLSLLGQMASDEMSELGMSLVEDFGGHLAIMLPLNILVEKRDVASGTIYQDTTGAFSAETFWRSSFEGSLRQHYQEAANPAPGKSITYSVLRDDFYVVSGRNGNRYYYELVHADGEATAGFRFEYGDNYRVIGGVASVFAASYSAPINPIELANTPGPTTAPRPMPKQPKVATVETPTAQPEPSPSKTRRFGSFALFDDAPGVIALVGDISLSSPLDFRRAVQAAGHVEILALASDGGLVSSALILAYEIRDMGIATWVMPDLGCYSACAFLFFAGGDRLAEGELGVHQVWGEQVDASSAQTAVSDILEAFSAFNVRPEVTSVMLRTVPEDMYIFDASELAGWEINRGEVF